MDRRSTPVHLHLAQTDTSVEHEHACRRATEIGGPLVHRRAVVRVPEQGHLTGAGPRVDLYGDVLGYPYDEVADPEGRLHVRLADGKPHVLQIDVEVADPVLVPRPDRCERHRVRDTVAHPG